jgi:D-amino-acid oxidase
MTGEVVVLGAGVIGLTTAVCLAEAGHRVRVLAAEPPERTTSAVASGLWGPGFGPRDRAWSRVSFTEFSALAAEPGTGVARRRGCQVSDLGTEPPPWVEELPELRICRPDELPSGMLVGLWATVPTVDLPRYLAHLTARLAVAGVGIELRQVETLDVAPVVVNCTGVAAGRLASDPSVQPVRGQHVVVRNPGLEHYYLEAVAGPEWAGIFPHGERVVLGGVAQPGNWSLEPDPAVADGILERCSKVEPALGGAEILGHEVGLRPGRPQVRLEEERVGGSRVVHNYGHGGMGVSLSWGCAREVATILATGR